jgi:hypothetical protein
MTRDEALIAQRVGARYVKIVDLENTERDPGISIMATFGKSVMRHLVLRLKYPLRSNWREDAVRYFQQERERA